MSHDDIPGGVDQRSGVGQRIAWHTAEMLGGEGGEIRISQQVGASGFISRPIRDHMKV